MACWRVSPIAKPGDSGVPEWVAVLHEGNFQIGRRVLQNPLLQTEELEFRITNDRCTMSGLHSGYSFILRGEEKIPVPSKLSTRSLSIETGDILQIHNQYYKLVMENETPVEQPQPIEDMPSHPMSEPMVDEVEASQKRKRADIEGNDGEQTLEKQDEEEDQEKQELKRRKLQELADEEFARKLQEEFLRERVSLGGNVAPSRESSEDPDDCEENEELCNFELAMQLLEEDKIMELERKKQEEADALLALKLQEEMHSSFPPVYRVPAPPPSSSPFAAAVKSEVALPPKPVIPSSSPSEGITPLGSRTEIEIPDLQGPQELFSSALANLTQSLKGLIGYSTPATSTTTTTTSSQEVAAPSVPLLGAPPAFIPSSALLGDLGVRSPLDVPSGWPGPTAFPASRSSTLSEADLKKLLEWQQDLSEFANTPPPPGLAVELFEHQKLAQGWMTKREQSKEEPRGGVLADDMGCGKTIEMIACMLANKRKGSQRTLIVAPVSCVYQWKGELESKIKDKSFSKIYIYHGPNRIRDTKELKKFDAVITTYTTLAFELEKLSKEVLAVRAPQKGPLLNMRWYRVVLDEAHSIKNKSTRTARSCCEIRAKRKWCLSGTPIQNSLDDLYSLFKFLDYAPYCFLDVWKGIVRGIDYDSESGFSRLRTLLKSVCIRRKKEDHVGGKQIVELPEKVINEAEADFSEAEADFYKALETASQIEFNEYVKAGTVLENFSNVLVLILRLRQACSHPSLVLNAIQVNHPEDISTDSASNLPEKAEALLPEEIRNRILSDDSVECPLCLDVRQSPMVTKCGHIFCKECIVPVFGGDDEKECPLCRVSMKLVELVPLAIGLGCTEKNNSADDDKAQEKGKEQEKEKEKEGMDNDSDLRDKTASSTKIKQLHRLVEAMLQQDKSHKGIIFSQWTSMLDIVESHLRRWGIRATRIDGTMSMQQRMEAIEEFKLPDVNIMLVSLKAGGLGLNLTMASYVFLLDLWWNPAVEFQAIDRVHRIGQTKIVNVNRFSIRNTIEERIKALQEKKLKIAEGALGTGSLKNMGRLTLDDLKFLFNV